MLSSAASGREVLLVRCRQANEATVGGGDHLGTDELNAMTLQWWRRHSEILGGEAALEPPWLVVAAMELGFVSVQAKEEEQGCVVVVKKERRGEDVLLPFPDDGTRQAARLGVANEVSVLVVGAVVVVPIFDSVLPKLD